jgi:UDP-glucose 4-epimerase
VKILVTGAGGRLGSVLVEALVNAGHEVNALDMQASRGLGALQRLGSRVKIFRGHLEFYAEVEPAVAGVDAVFHLGAAMGSFTDFQFYTSNVTGLFHVLQAVRRVAPNIQRFAFPSSDAVFEKYIPGGLTAPIQPEATVRDGKGLYAMTKILGEEMCWSYLRTYGTPCTVYRFPIARAATELPDFYEFWVDGLLNHKRGQRRDPGAPEAVAILEKLQQEAGGEKRLLVARDENGRPYQRVYVDARDVVQALMGSLNNSAATGRSFGVAGKDQPANSAQIVPYLSKKLGVPYVEANLPGIPTFYDEDISNTKSVLGYEPKYDVFHMIDEAIAARKA